MRNKILFGLLIVSGLTNLGFSQETKYILQLDVVEGTGDFFRDLKTSDIQIAGFKDFSLTLETDKALEVMIMIDASASQEKTLPHEKKAAQMFINDFLKAEKDKIAIVSFTGKLALEQDLTNDFQKAKDQIGKIEFVPPAGYLGGGVMVGQTPPNKNQTAAGSSSIWDSLKQVLDAFSKVQENGAQRAIILISDGVNTYGETKLQEVVEHSVKTKVPIYAIGIGDDFYDGVDKKTLRKITSETGGISITPKKKLEDLPALLKIIERALRSGYVLNFVSNSPLPKKGLQEVKIEITNPNLRERKIQTVHAKGVFVSN